MMTPKPQAPANGLPPVKNIIFDLGQVILNVNWRLTYEAFQELGIRRIDRIFDKLHQQDVFSNLQTGKLDSRRFIRYLLQYLPNGATEQQVVDAWNAMLLDYPRKRLHLIHELSREFRTFLLSNTNKIHWERYHPQYLQILEEENLPPLFEKEYYSHEIGLAKPDTAIYKLVLNEQNLQAGETLFLDDKPENLEAAEQLNIHTQLVSAQNELLDIFQKAAD